jgi:hypothetical protein
MAPFEGDLCPSHEFRGAARARSRFALGWCGRRVPKGPLGARSDVGDELDVLMTR